MGLAPCASYGQGAKKGPPRKIRVLLAEDRAPDTEKVNQEDRCRPNSPCIDEDQPQGLAQAHSVRQWQPSFLSQPPSLTTSRWPPNK